MIDPFELKVLVKSVVHGESLAPEYLLWVNKGRGCDLADSCVALIQIMFVEFKQQTAVQVCNLIP